MTPLASPRAGGQGLVERMRGAKGQPHAILSGGGHFLQEDIPAAFTDALTGWLRGSGVGA